MSFCPYHFVQCHFVRVPFCPYHFVRTILSAIPFCTVTFMHHALHALDAPAGCMFHHLLNAFPLHFKTTALTGTGTIRVQANQKIYRMMIKLFLQCGSECWIM